MNYLMIKQETSAGRKKKFIIVQGSRAWIVSGTVNKVSEVTKWINVPQQRKS
jgi:hypothetical protein